MEGVVMTEDCAAVLASIMGERFTLLKEFSAATDLLLREGIDAVHENLERRDVLIVRLQETDARKDKALEALSSAESTLLQQVWNGEPPPDDAKESVCVLHLRALAVRTQAEILLQQEERVREMMADAASALREEMRGHSGNRRALEYYRSLVPEPRSGLTLDENS